MNAAWIWSAVTGPVRTPLLLALATVGSGLLLLAIRRWGVRRTAVAVAVLISLGASMESAWKVAGSTLDQHGVWQAIPAMLFESAWLSYAARAVEYHRSHRHDPDAPPNPYIRWVWAFAVAAGLVMANASTSRREALLRLAIPLVGAGVWYGDYIIRRHGAAAVTWALSPRRIGIRLGLIEPGDRDLRVVHREHRIDALARTAHRYHHGWRWARGWHAARLRRLALAADDDMVAEAQRRVQRVHRITDLTAPRTPDRSERTPDRSERTPDPGSVGGPDPRPDPQPDPTGPPTQINGRTPHPSIHRTVRTPQARTPDRSANDEALASLRTLRQRLGRTPSLDQIRDAVSPPGGPRCGQGRAQRLQRQLKAETDPDAADPDAATVTVLSSSSRRLPPQATNTPPTTSSNTHHPHPAAVAVG